MRVRPRSAMYGVGFVEPGDAAAVIALNPFSRQYSKIFLRAALMRASLPRADLTRELLRARANVFFYGFASGRDRFGIYSRAPRIGFMKSSLRERDTHHEPSVAGRDVCPTAAFRGRPLA